LAFVRLFRRHRGNLSMVVFMAEAEICGHYGIRLRKCNVIA
jgi:hypothetical protein